MSTEHPTHLSQGYVLVSVAVLVTQFVHNRRHMLFPDIFSRDFQRYERVHIPESTIAIVQIMLIKRLFTTSQFGPRLLATDAQQIFWAMKVKFTASILSMMQMMQIYSEQKKKKKKKNIYILLNFIFYGRFGNDFVLKLATLHQVYELNWLFRRKRILKQYTTLSTRGERERNR